MAKTFLRYFLQGLLYIVPITVTVYVVYFIFQAIDGIIPIDIPGLGFVTIILVITAVGYLGPRLFTKPFVGFIEQWIEKTPLVKLIYGSVKDLIAAFVDNKKRFSKPVIVKMNKDAELYKLGFVTQKDLSELGMGAEFVAVYLPHSYNFSGNVFIVPQENVRELNVPSSEVMKFIVSGGVTGIDKYFIPDSSLQKDEN